MRLTTRSRYLLAPMAAAALLLSACGGGGDEPADAPALAQAAAAGLERPASAGVRALRASDPDEDGPPELSTDCNDDDAGKET